MPYSGEKRRTAQHPPEERQSLWSFIQQMFRNFWNFLRCKLESEPRKQPKSDEKEIMLRCNPSPFRPSSRQSEHFLGEGQVELLDVQRKSSLAPPTPGPECVKPAEPITEETVDLVFLGRGGSGITCTVWTLLNLLPPENANNQNHQKEAVINYYTIQVSGKNHNFLLHIHDFPGFIKGDNVQNDAELAAAVSKYMEKHLKNKVPDAVFITAKLSDNRFAGDSSNFKKMLVSLSHSRAHWGTGPDEHVSLVLTDARSVESAVVHQKQVEYEETFADIFSEWKGKSVVIDNAQLVDSRTGLIRLIEERNLSLAIALKKLKPNSLKSSLKVKHQESVLNLLAQDGEMEVNKILSSLLNATPFEIQPPDLSPYRYISWVSYQENDYGSNGKTSCFLGSMKVLLADRLSTRPIKDLRKGDKLLDASLRGYNVVEGIRGCSIHELEGPMGPMGVCLGSKIEDTALSCNNGRDLNELDLEVAEEHFKRAFGKESKSGDVFVIKLTGFGDRSSCIVDGFVVICD